MKQSPTRLKKRVSLSALILIGFLVVAVRYRTETARETLMEIARRNRITMAESASFGAKRPVFSSNVDDGEAWPYYLKALTKQKEIYESQVKGSSGFYGISNLKESKPSQSEAAGREVFAYRDALLLIQKAQNQQFFCRPENRTERFYDQVLPPYEVEKLSDLLIVASRLAETDGKQMEAIQLALRAYCLWEDLFFVTTWYHAGQVFQHQSVVLHRILKLLSQNRLQSPEYAQLQAHLMSLYQTQVPWSAKMRYQRVGFLARITKPAIDRRFGEYGTFVSHCGGKPSQLKLKMEEIERSLEGHFFLPRTLAFIQKKDQVFQLLEKAESLDLRSLLRAIPATQDKESLLNAWQIQAEFRACLFIVSLHQKSIEQRTSPTNISELIQQVTASSPAKDPFSSAPFLYRLDSHGTGLVFWSLGPDLDDDGGKSVPEPDWLNSNQDGDLVFQAQLSTNYTILE
ncbi:MAG: hypothetical protein HY774_07640 [Acidobacteria bacterium]|nr:hypothetical protein [Acidobacteriota bacterium]